MKITARRKTKMRLPVMLVARLKTNFAEVMTASRPRLGAQPEQAGNGRGPTHWEEMAKEKRLFVAC